MAPTKYTPYGVKLTLGQIKKIKSAHDKGLEVTIKIAKGNLSGNDKLHLTESQINQIQRAGSKVGVQLKLSKTQLDHMEKVGGFLPLLAAIPAIIAAMGGLAGGVASAVNSTRQTNEQKRHNQELENIAKGGSLKSILTKIGVGKLNLNKIAKGKCISCDGFQMKKIGEGLYLEPQGRGLFLGPSPNSLNSSAK
jgi:hypothetical protein